MDHDLELTSPILEICGNLILQLSTILEILEIEVFNIVYSPGSIGHRSLFSICSYPGNIGNWILLIFLASWKYGRRAGGSRG